MRKKMVIDLGLKYKLLVINSIYIVNGRRYRKR